VATVALTVATLVAVVACGALLTAWWRSDGVEGPSAKDMAGNVVAFDAPDAAAAQVEEMGETFSAPAQELTVPLLSAVAVNGVINPPTLTDAYLYREYGDPRRPRSGTVVVAVHSVRGGQAPGNALVEPASGDHEPAVRVRAGDELVVAGVRYRVTATELVAKSETARDDSIWQGRSGLVVLTCFPDPAVRLADQLNLVVRAERVDARG
jgi:hypothetical protein